MVTLRRVRELHPVSRHVFPFRSESGSVLRVACCVSFGKMIVGEYPVTLRSFRVDASRVGKPAQTPNTSLLLLRVSVCPSAVSVCQPAGLLRAGQPTRSAITCPPAPHLMVRVCDACWSAETLLPKQLWRGGIKKKFFSYPPSA